MRTVAECAEESAADVGVMTTLLESRLLAGSRRAAGAPCASRWRPERIWPVREFFEAKVREQQRAAPEGQRHRLQPRAQRQDRPGRTARHPDHRLGCQAPLRRRHRSMGWSTHGFLTPAELRRLKQAQAFLWKVRFGLHTLTGRHEDRLLFDHQIQLAQSFGYEDASYTLAVEQFMQRYYRTVMDVSAAQRAAAAAVPRGDPHRERAAAAAQCALPGAQRLARGGQRGCVRAHPFGAAGAVRAAAAEPADPRRARLDHARGGAQPVADR